VARPSGVLATGPEAVWLAANGTAASTLVRSSDHDAPAQAVSRGEGLAVLPVPVAMFHPLRCVQLLDDVPERVIWLAYHQDLRRDARVQRVAAEVATVIAAAQVPT
jgi:DNA-binding transcriptional LysR family regulator